MKLKTIVEGEDLSVLYHGTDLKHLDRIMQYGLDPKLSNGPMTSAHILAVGAMPTSFI